MHKKKLLEETFKRQKVGAEVLRTKFSNRVKGGRVKEMVLLHFRLVTSAIIIR